MEKLHKEPGGYTKDSSSFTLELQKFHDTRGTPFRHAPRINGREVDLFALYNCVTGLGGWQKVNDQLKWERVLEKLKFPRACANGSLALRQIYVRYLSTFEKVHYLGEDPDEDGDPTSEARARKPNASLLCQVPMAYNRVQHELTEAQRAGANMAPLAPPPSEYSKLCLSLLSCMPNEESLALNVCTLLSNEGRHVLRLDHCPRLIDLLLAQAGVFSFEDPTLRPMYLECWQGVEGRRMERFWEDNLDSETIALFNIGSGHKEEDELFNLNYEISTRSIEGQRILRIALVFHNLSFEDRNVQPLASNPTFIRFVMMCALSRWSSLRQVALDTLGNLASKLVLDPVETEWSGPLVRIAREGILSRDRYLVVRCLDIVGQLSRGERNEEPLLAQMDGPLYGRIFELLTVHDLMLLVYALEALYLLSDLGPSACDHMLQVHQSVGILVSLLTLDPLAYGASAQKGMRLIEVADPHPVAPTPAVLRPAVPPSPIPEPPPPAPAVDPEAESFACTWVRAMYEPAHGCSVGRNDVYAEYVTFCNRAGRKAMVPASVFASCVKTVYSQTGIRRVDGPNGTVSLHHEGLRKRLAPLPVPIQVTSCLTISTQATPTRAPVAPAAANHGPILKAQLSAPLRALTPPATPTATQQPSPPSSPASQPTPSAGTQGSSNLIKSLLANKVSRNLQRQQQLQQTQSDSDASTPVLASAAVAKPPAEAAVTHNSTARGKVSQPGSSACTPKTVPVVVTRLNGIQRDLMLEGKQVDESLHNHVGENGGVAEVKVEQQHLQDVEMTEEKPNVEASLEEVRKAPEVVYKSSPLLNGLLDKGKVPLSKEMVTALQNGRAGEEEACGNGVAKVSVTNGAVRVVASSDLSPISDIVGSVESASKVISRSNVEAASCSRGAAKRTVDAEEETSSKRPRLGECTSPRADGTVMLVEEARKAATVPQPNLVKLLSTDADVTHVKILNVPASTVIVSSTLDPTTVSSPLVKIEASRLAPTTENAGTSSVPLQPASSVSVSVANVASRTSQGSVTLAISSSPTVISSPQPVTTSQTAVVQPTLASSAVLTTMATTSVPVPAAALASQAGLPSAIAGAASALPLPASASGGPVMSCAQTLHGIVTTQGTIVGPGLALPVMTVSSMPSTVITQRVMTVPLASSLPMQAGVISAPASTVATVQGTLAIPSTQLAPRIITVAVSNITSTTPMVMPMVTNSALSIASTPVKSLVVGGSTMSASAPAAVSLPVPVVSTVVPTPCAPSIRGNSPLAFTAIVSSVTPAPAASTVGKVNAPSGAVAAAPTAQTASALQSVPVMSSAAVTNVSAAALTAVTSFDGGTTAATASTVVAPMAAMSTTAVRVVAAPTKTADNKSVGAETDKKPGQSVQQQQHHHHHHHHHHHKPAKLMYNCEWKGCERTFTTPSAVLFHACKMHVPAAEGDFVCLWEGCDDMKRRRLSLFTHLQDRHCSEQVLQIQAVRRQQISQFGKASLPPPAQPPPHPGYAPDAAYLAIRRHALAYYNHRDAADEKESALAKSIRLTAALVLRNLATHSALARRRLRRYEQQLSAVAMSPLESSRTIAQCLREMSRAPSPN